jgi:TRAP-type mannitol/chloroaromatic compound transport system substrate-binding protein
MVTQRVLTIILIILIVIAGIGGYFAGSTAVPPPETVVTITETVTIPITVTVTATPAPEKVYRWRLVTHLAIGERRASGVHYFAELVKNLSGGRLIIEVYGGGELFPVTETYTQLARGTIEAAATYTGYWAALDPVMALMGAIPWPLTKPNELWYYLESIRDIAEKNFRERWGLVYIGPLTLATTESLMCRIPIKSVTELRGRIVRSSGIGIAFYEKLGAKAITLPVGEIYTALQLGTVDCAEWNDYGTNYDLGFHEVAKYVLEPPPGGTLHTGVFLDHPLVINPKAWEELPDDLKLIVKIAAQATWQYTSYYCWGDQHLWGKELWIKAGATIFTTPEEDKDIITEAQIAAIVDQAKRGPVALEIVKRMVKVVRDLGYTWWADALESALRSEGLI